MDAKNAMNQVNADARNWAKTKIAIHGMGFQLGPYYGNAVRHDLKHIAFTLSRYKFACKMLMYRNAICICELGCQEGLGAVMLHQNTDLKRYVGIDLDAEAIRWNRENLDGPFEFIEANFFEYMPAEKFDAVISLDVIEHIKPEMEDEYCNLITGHLKDSGNSGGGGVAIIGTPNIAFNPYASEASRAVHINLYDQKKLYELLNRHFDNVFIFNMNDEVINTGFAPMSCYIFAVCTGIK